MKLKLILIVATLEVATISHAEDCRLAEDRTKCQFERNEAIKKYLNIKCQNAEILGKCLELKNKAFAEMESFTGTKPRVNGDNSAEIELNEKLHKASSYHCPDANASDYEKHPDIKIVTGKGETFKFARDHLYKMLPTIGVATRLNVEQTKYLESRANQTHYTEETKSINKLNVNFERFPIYDCRYQGEFYSTALVMKPGKHYLPKRVLDILQQPKFKHLLSLSWLERQCGDKKLYAQVWLATPSWKNDNRGDDAGATVGCMTQWDTDKSFPGKFNLHVTDEDKYDRYSGKHTKIYSAEYMMELLANME